MTKDSDRYNPIECGLHSQFELAIMRQLSVSIHWKDEFGVQEAVDAMLLDIFAKSGAEYLSVKLSSNDTIQIRLDRILSFES